MIKILPLDQIRNNNISIKKIENKDLFNLKDLIGDFVYFRLGRDAISSVVEFLNLKREDEVYITTTTDTSYVSTCVSATIFNYSKISRVLTDKTKAIFVIHTFGFPHPKLFELAEIANERKIPLIEDCISSFDSYNKEGIRLGSLGDFSIYSIYKIIPTEYGGILTFKNKKTINGISDNYLEKEIKEWTPKLWYIKKRRIENYNFLLSKLSNSIYGNITNENPFMFGYISEKYNEIMNNNLIEFGKTHIKYEVHIPVNPFLDFENINIKL